MRLWAEQVPGEAWLQFEAKLLLKKIAFLSPKGRLAQNSPSGTAAQD